MVKIKDFTLAFKNLNGGTCTPVISLQKSGWGHVPSVPYSSGSQTMVLVPFVAL